MRRFRRTDDMTADQVEEFFGSLPRMARGLRFLARAALFLVVFTIASNLVIAHRTEVQQHQIRATAYKQCRLVNDNARAINGLIDTVILRIQQADLSASEKAQAVRLYTSSKQALPVCEKP